MPASSTLTAELAAAARHPSEFVALLRYRRKISVARRALTHVNAVTPHWTYAFAALKDVSRSFAVVIMELHEELRRPVAVFYLVLRALDTIEDDTSVSPCARAGLCRRFYTFLDYYENATEHHANAFNSPTPRHRDGEDLVSPQDDSSSIADTQQDQDLHHCNTSYGTPESSPDIDYEIEQQLPQHPWSSSDFGSGAEKILLQNFPLLLRCYSELKPSYRRVIRHITKRMGAGMAEHINDVDCKTVADYDLYCHYVAGLVGYGLSDMFAESGAEESAFSSRTHLSNSMGLFLQKTNIIRDYLEDNNDGRTFWPEEIWGHYASSLSDFAQCGNRKVALPALNHMVTDALRHVPDCLEYMSFVRNPHVFNFVAIPQVMAIATLGECFNNGEVFEKKVKIRRSLTAKLIMRTKSMDDLYKLFFEYAVDMLRHVEPSDPCADATRTLLNAIIDICAPHVPAVPDLVIPNVLSILAFCVLSGYGLKRRAEHYDGAVFTWRSAGGIMEPVDMLLVSLLFMVCIYLFSFFLLPYITRAQMEEVRRMESAKRAAEQRRIHAHHDRNPHDVGNDGRFYLDDDFGAIQPQWNDHAVEH